jgi:uncharacterized membrane protein
MNKIRLEALTDGIFAIVMTLLVIEIKVPELHDHFSETALIDGLKSLLPLFFSFALSFAVLVNYWFSHNFLITVMAKNTSRNLSYINLLFLAFVSLIPFSSHLLGSYPESNIAVAIYSLHVLIIALLIFVIREYIIRSPRIENPESENLKLDAHGKFTSKDSFYGVVRIILAVGCAVLALIFSFFNTYLSIFLLLIPVFTGIVPGSLGFILWLTRLEKLAVKEISKL